MSAPDREAYAASQAQLLDALLRGDPPPPGFVAAQIDAAGSALRRKRGRAVARAWPALALSLGDRFAPRFDAFARATRGPGGLDDAARPLLDGLAFTRSIQTAGETLDEDVRVEILLARAALRQRGWLQVARLQRPHPRLLVVARLPSDRLVHHSVRLRPRARRCQPKPQ